jgi:hypothetical protein
MTIEDIEQVLPNGFHDSIITGVHVNYAERTAQIDIDNLVSGPDAADEEYRSVKLCISGLLYFVIEPPEAPYTAHPELSIVDGGSSEVASASPLPKPLPAGAFTYWFFVNNWNSFIHVAALHAELVVPPT